MIYFDKFTKDKNMLHRLNHDFEKGTSTCRNCGYFSGKYITKCPQCEQIRLLEKQNKILKKQNSDRVIDDDWNENERKNRENNESDKWDDYQTYVIVFGLVLLYIISRFF